MSCFLMSSRINDLKNQSLPNKGLKLMRKIRNWLWEQFLERLHAFFKWWINSYLLTVRHTGESRKLKPEWKTCKLSWLMKAMWMVKTCVTCGSSKVSNVQYQDNTESEIFLKWEDGIPTGLDESECCPSCYTLKPYYKANYVMRKASTLKAFDLETFQKPTNTFLCSAPPPQFSVTQRVRPEDNQAGNQSCLPMIKLSAGQRTDLFTFLDLSSCFLKQTRGSVDTLRYTNT